MVIASNAYSSLTRQWRQQIRSHRGPQPTADRQGFVAASFIDRTGTGTSLVGIDNLLVVVLHEELRPHQTQLSR